MNLQDFNLRSFLPEDTVDIEMRMSHMPTRGAHESVYLVFAYPRNAKVRKSRGGGIVSIWPEVCIGMLSREEWRTGRTANWAIYPTLRNEGGWRKKPIDVVVGREMACSKLLVWWAHENKKREGAEGGTEKSKREFAERVFDAYMLTYDTFCTDTDEVAKLLKVSQSHARLIGEKLEEVSLINIEKTDTTTGMRVSGRGIVQSRGPGGKYAPDDWQCWETYDSIDRLRAIDLFIEKHPVLANWAAKKIANEHTKTRLENSTNA